MGVVERNNVTVSGKPHGRTLLFAHGFGCDQNMWRLVAPAFADRFKVVLFDHVGAGGSDLSAYDATKYASLDGYADDILAIVEELDLVDVVVVGHSVSAMIGALAVQRDTDRFTGLVMIGPSARYLNDDDYVGGFDREDIEDMLRSLDSNYLDWSSQMAPAIIGNPDRPELGEELTNSFCRTDPTIAHAFATATFMSDNRGDLAGISIPTLILQCRDDFIAPESAGEFVRDAIAGSTYEVIDATGHCPNLSHPAETIDAIERFLQS